jgi:hypothetical protein
LWECWGIEVGLVVFVAKFTQIYIVNMTCCFPRLWQYKLVFFDEKSRQIRVEGVR